MKNLGAGAQALGKCRRTDRLDHELLNIHVVVGMFPAVEDIHHRHRHGQLGAAIDLRDVLVKGNPPGQGCRFGGRQGHGQNRIGAKFRLVVRAVGRDHRVIELTLGCCIIAQQQVADCAVDVPDRGQYAFTEVAGAVAIAQLQSLPGAGGSTGGRAGRAYLSGFQSHLGQYRGIAPGIHDFKGLYVRNIATHWVHSVN